MHIRFINKPTVLISAALLSLTFNPAYATTPIPVHAHSQIPYPDMESGQIFRPVFTLAQKYLFYTGQKGEQAVAGYYRSRSYLGWEALEFPLFTQYPDHPNKRIVATSNGPASSVIALSSIADVGDAISTSWDGASWSDVWIYSPQFRFSKLNYTDSSVPQAITYGDNHTQFLGTYDGRSWYSGLLPNSCLSDTRCHLTQQTLTDFLDVSTLFQTSQSTVRADSLYSTTLYVTRNLHDWYTRPELPFAHEPIQKIMKPSADVLLVTTGTPATSKLWLTPDLQNWRAIDLPEDFQINDAVTTQNHKILLVTAPPPQADGQMGQAQVLLFDPSASVEAITPITTDPYFQTTGRIEHLTLSEGQWYVSGNFLNEGDKKQLALATLD